MNLSDFHFDLPPDLIAQRPLAERDASRMLILDRSTGAFEDRRFRDFPDLLRGDELIILNNARVMPARLFGRRAGIHAAPPGKENPERAQHLTAEIEVLLVRPLPSDEGQGRQRWEALVKPGRKIPVGESIVFGANADAPELTAHVEDRGDFGLRVLRFDHSATTTFHDAVARLGHIPLPPYIKRDDDASDRERYQTVYARQQEPTAVAAPTAGLHFTPDILARVKARGCEIAEVTLDVGLGTFEPVRTEILEDHKIHAESYEISERTADAITKAKAAQRPIIAVGTTVVRTLEDAAEKSASASSTLLKPGRAEASIFLYPGKAIRMVDQLLTNFHLPESSLVALVATLSGRENILRAYRHAVAERYRFYSYGDCMFIRSS
jgi:S-adenosylmethionine:tRNA ribosyltransferase-isomerase